MAANAHKSPAELAEYKLGGLKANARVSLEAHLDACATCQKKLEEVATLVGSVDDWAPRDADDLAIQRRISAALNIDRLPLPLGEGRGEGTHRMPWRWISVATAAAAMASVALWFAVGGNASNRPAVVASGEVHMAQSVISAGGQIAEEVAVEAIAEAEIKLAEGSMVRLAPGARARMQQGGALWNVEKGTVAFRVKKRKVPLSVDTAEALVRVLGTTFAVDRQDERGLTSVSVTEGRVEVLSHLNGERRLLGAGERIEVSKPVVVAAVEPEPKPVATDSAPLPPPTREVHLQEIRSRIRTGQIKAARAMVKKARALAKGEALAELAIVEAEILLAERRHHDAIASYLQVDRFYRGTYQGESAAFAAAQLAVDHPEAGYSGRVLLRRYLQSYPKGRFRDEAEQLLRVSKK